MAANRARRTAIRAGLSGVLIAWLAGAAPARAAQVRLEVSTRETYVGVPITLQLIIENAAQPEAPEPPEIPGATIRSLGAPSQSTRIEIFNGVQRQSRSLTYQYQLTPKREGAMTIPAFRVQADGSSYTTQPISIVVSQSETTDLLIVEVKGARPSVYVGEQLKLTLDIWVRPYVNRQHNVSLSELDMLRRLDGTATQWGIFNEPIQQMMAQSQRPIGREMLRKDSQGSQHTYFLYQVERTMWPDRPGPIQLGDINIVFSYPTGVGRTNDPFSFGSLSITGTRPLAAAPKASPVVVKPIPTAGRPASYRDAVGRYTISAAAKPTEVAVGDPITLTLSISGDGRIDSLQAPPLPELDVLTRAFKVPKEPLAGTVAGNTKSFTQSIRAQTDDVRQIPPIPFVYFDPALEKFVTVHTNPIPIRVKPAERLPMSQIVESGGAKTASARQLTEVSGGILANYGDMDEVLSQQAFQPGTASAAALALPPLIYLGGWVLRRRRDRLRHDTSFARRRSARRRALSRIDTASQQEATALADHVTGAITGYIADRCNLPPAGLTRLEVLRCLETKAPDPAITRQVDELLQRCEGVQYAGMVDGEPRELAGAARDLIARLEREKF